MGYCVDVNHEYQLAKGRMLKYSLLFSLVLALIIVSDVLLMLLAGEDYIINLIIAIVITTLFSWFAIYFFTNVYNDIDSRYRYFKGYASGIKPVDEVVFLKISDELCFVNGLYVYAMSVRYVSALDSQDKIIFCMSNDLNYEIGDKLTITTYQRILLKAEKHQ